MAVKEILIKYDDSFGNRLRWATLPIQLITNTDLAHLIISNKTEDIIFQILSEYYCIPDESFIQQISYDPHSRSFNLLLAHKSFEITSLKGEVKELERKKKFNGEN